jgi:ubiquinone/menaquinone biosynthesis C-methylase UbiE
MNLYERWILPRLLDLAMRNKEATRYRSELVPRARGTVLEVGAGSGLNLPFYDRRVERLYALDPSEALLNMARKKARRAPFPVELLARSGEDIPLADGAVDTVVVTWALCTIPDPAKALREMRRVLKPQGMLLFAEHGLAPDAGVRAWQHTLNPGWRRVAGGCNLDRNTADLIRASGFGIVKLDTGYAKAPRLLGYMYVGQARPLEP